MFPTMHFEVDPVLGWFLAASAVIILGIAKSGFGGGVGIVAVPMFAIAFGAQRGTAILLPLLIAADVFSVYNHWGNWDTRTLKVLSPGTLAGIGLGSVILYLLVVGPVFPPPSSHGAAATAPAASMTAASATAPATVAGAEARSPGRSTAKKTSEDALNLITGVVSVLYVLLDQIRLRFAPQWHFRPNHASGFGAGMAVGVISTLAHAAGPVAAIFLLGQGLPRAAFMGTTVIYFFGINTIKLIPYTAIPNLIDWETVKAGLWLCWLTPLGTWLGKWLCDRLSERAFRNTIMIIVFLSGMQLVLEWYTGIKLATWIAGMRW